MSARIEEYVTYVLRCDDHPEWATSAKTRESAEKQAEAHDYLFHNDPEEKSTWPSRP